MLYISGFPYFFSIFLDQTVTKNELNRVFEKYIMQYVMVFYSVSAVGVVAYIFFKTSAIMKSLYKQARCENQHIRYKKSGRQPRQNNLEKY